MFGVIVARHPHTRAAIEAVYYEPTEADPQRKVKIAKKTAAATDFWRYFGLIAQASASYS